MSNAGHAHLQAIKRVLCYLEGATDVEITDSGSRMDLGNGLATVMQTMLEMHQSCSMTIKDQWYSLRIMSAK